LSLVLAAVGAAVAALIQSTVLPFAAEGGGGLDLVLVIAVVWTMALGLEGGLVWAFLGGLIIDVLLMRPLGLTAFIDLLAVGTAWVIGRVFVRALYPVIVVTVAILAAVTIGPASGGGFYLTPDAKPDDGLFDFCRLGDFGKLEALRHLPKALDGSHVGLAKTQLRRGRSVTLRADRPLTAHVDGNLLRNVACATPLTFRIHPGALRVVGRW